MKPETFIVIGENIHATRSFQRKGKRIVHDPAGEESVRYQDEGGRTRFLRIPEAFKSTQDYEEGRVKHVRIAIEAAMSGAAKEADEGRRYLRQLVRRQVQAGASFLDLNVDEISLKLAEQIESMEWLVRFVQESGSVPLSVDSSDMEIISAGLRASDGRSGRTLLNSASLERIDALELATAHKSRVIVTAAGGSGMPSTADERISNASRMIDASVEKGIELQDIFVDPLVFPISVDIEFGKHCLEAIRTLRERYGPEIHITGGFSNVSFGMPTRKLINDVFLLLAVDAGADGGITDPVTSRIEAVYAIDRSSSQYRLAEDLLLGRDRNCRTFLRAYRAGELS